MTGSTIMLAEQQHKVGGNTTIEHCCTQLSRSAFQIPSMVQAVLAVVLLLASSVRAFIPQGAFSGILCVACEMCLIPDGNSI